MQVVAAKAAVIARTPQLHTVLGDGALASAEGVNSSCYSLVSGAPLDSALLPLYISTPCAADIRQCSAMEQVLLKVA